jgi:hypothetical protein
MRPPPSHNAHAGDDHCDDNDDDRDDTGASTAPHACRKAISLVVAQQPPPVPLCHCHRATPTITHMGVAEESKYRSCSPSSNSSRPKLQSSSAQKPEPSAAAPSCFRPPPNRDMSMPCAAACAGEPSVLARTRTTKWSGPWWLEVRIKTSG